ncbi:MAG: hypothetical protein N2578_05100 [Bdellovibrionaceae bacterium]|nr:hypothetical protein [Pseudobdellovibrionaceae bacterium]
MAETAAAVFVCSLVTLLIVTATAGNVAKFWLRYHLHEALVCMKLSDRTDCEWTAERNARRLPLTPLANLDLRKMGPFAYGKASSKFIPGVELEIEMQIRR